ncbi:hypothetical protein [Mariniradius sediminis]|uniref:DKNYY family protein n=1 Tax=Mariniradius sediminis TaxID=2909237 RepID=A0ABS9BNR2_9BACT|nr:hypothetical protein [Mariniradius sediminis]MCF1749657.1 hypothetical protein [Mariniradius sediminis]
MKDLIILTVVLLAFSCSNPHDSKVAIDDKRHSTNVDSLSAKVDILHEGIKYIGFIDSFYFSNENEAYVELYFIQDEISSDEYENIVDLSDSLIYKDDENSRHRIPADIASKYFDLRGLSKLKIYDTKHNLVSGADFLRVEYLDQNISPVFIAVYRTDKRIVGDSYYGIGNFSGQFRPIKFTVSSDTILSGKLLAQLGDKQTFFGLKDNGTHLHFNSGDTVLSVINSDNYAYIVLTTPKEFQVLYKSVEYENYTDLKIIPLGNGIFPYILTRNVQPDTDVMWDRLLFFDGTKYTSADRQRVEK